MASDMPAAVAAPVTLEEVGSGRGLSFAPELLHTFFERWATANPEALAVRCGNEALSYGRLNARAESIARRLRALGIGPGKTVGLFLPRSLEVYAGMLGILKAGAAYVPLDPEYPAERVEFILNDSGAQALVTVSDLAGRSAGFKGSRLELDALPDCDATGKGELAPMSGPMPGPTPNDLCYIIYTSGSTGRPKGVAIEHRSAAHLVRTEAELFDVRPGDRVFQGFSIAFDASVEEIWLAFAAGATLVAGTAEMIHAGAGLSKLLTEAGVTVLSCVPTLLAMMEEEVPGLRLLILGGEVCPPELVKRWWRRDRRVVNTYGPTEATVIATWAECRPGEPVTIGKPIAGYLALVLDDRQQSVREGQPGELCLGGIGLARGYVGRPELMREKFIQFEPAGRPPLRLYRTGDEVRQLPDGNFEFLGRLDAQVKLRGFRVELGEIECALVGCSGVQAAAVALREERAGVPLLVAYVVPRHGLRLDERKLREQLRATLPAYMVPALVELLPGLPTLPSGKVDRKSLPAPTSTPSENARETVPPGTPEEAAVFEVWEKLFAPQIVSVTDDFFLDLGGHSLLAARMVSELRRKKGFEKLSMLEAYRHPTIRALAEVFRCYPAENRTAETRDHAATPGAAAAVPFWRHFCCGAAQAVALLFVLSFFALQWLTPYLTYTVLVDQEYDFTPALLWSFASLIAFYPLMLCLPLLAKWLIIGRYKPGRYPLWGSYYFRWWLVTTIEAAVPVGYLTGTPLLNIYARLMGARIGRDVYLGSESFAIHDLLEIGDGASINADSNLLGYTIEDGWLKLGSISIGRDCFVGARSALGLNTKMDDGASLEDLSSLPAGGRIPRKETWRGAPARKAAASAPSEGSPTKELAGARASLQRRFCFALLHVVGVLVFPTLVVAAIFPGIVVMNRLNYIDPYYWYLLLAPLVGLSFVVLLALEIAGLKWLFLGRVRAGNYPLHSFRYFRKWFVDQTMDLSLDVLGPLYASVYLPPWYRLLGAKLGKGAEVSTASFISPDLLEIGDESFIADSVSLGAPRVRDGWMKVGANRIGKRSFIGNSALLPPDAVVGESVLIGCLSVPPDEPADALRTDSAWFGSPSFFLPQRQKAQTFSDAATFHPPVWLRGLRAAIEFVRVITPSTCFIVFLSLLFSALLLLNDVFSLGTTLLFFPMLYIACGFGAAAVTIVAKWVLVWRYRSGEKPLWNHFVWRNELLNALHEHLAEPFLVGALTGTPFVCWYFRLLGAKIGKRVYMETTDFSEFDLAEIGDEATLNADCTVQTHLFEDRVMKMGTVEIGPRCRVGAGSLVLYDTRMEPGSALGDLSLLMKGETLPRETAWEGVPARPLNERTD